MTATVGIVAHVAREEHAWQLADTVDAESITYDDGTLGCLGNHLRVWRKYENHPQDWIVVLEDDAVPCPQFRAQLAAALAAAPAPIVSLYLGTGYPTHWQDSIRQVTMLADHADTAWILARHLLHAVGVAIRVEMLPGMLAHIHQASRARVDRSVLPLPIDEAITEWAQDRDHSIAYTWPSLVDHADEGTLAAHQDGATRTEPRRAWRHGTRDHWSPSSVELTF